MQAMGSYRSLWLFALVIISLCAILTQNTAFVKRYYNVYKNNCKKIIRVIICIENKILGVVKMTRVANLLIQEAVEEAVKETENKKAVEIAISLLDVLNVETIAAKTKLTVEKVNELKEEYLKNKS